MKSFFNGAKRVAKDYSEHNIGRLSAEATYYIILSIVPFLIIALTAISVFLSHNTDILDQFLALLPPDSQHTLENLIDDLTKNQSGTLFSIGIITAFWTMSAGTRALINALNTMLGLDHVEEGMIKMYSKAFFFTIIGTVTGLLGLILSVYGPAFLQVAQRFIFIPKEIVSLATMAATLLPLISFTLVLTLFYHYAPRKETDKDTPEATKESINKLISWKRSFAGGLLATILWLALTYGYRFYVTNFAGSSSTYGPLVGIMILFVWINWSVQVILLSAEIVRDRSFDAELKAEAVKLKMEQIEQLNKEEQEKKEQKELEEKKKLEKNKA